MHVSIACLHSHSIWDLPLSSNDKQRNHLFRLKRVSSPLPLKGGFGGESNNLTQLQESNETIQEDGIGVVLAHAFIFTPLYQPFKVIRLLIQHGYEPVSPYSVTNRGITDFLMSRPATECHYLPGVFGYSRGMARKFGWKCLFAGLGPSICQMLADTIMDIFLSQRVDKFLRKLLKLPDKDEITTSFNVKMVLLLTMKSTILQSYSLLYSYPFFVVGNFGILRCVKGEPSVWIWSVFRQVWQEAGIGGFYSGILALWLYQVLNIWCEEVLVEIFRILVLLSSESEQPERRDGTGDYTLAHLIISAFTYPLSLICSIMTANKCSSKRGLDMPQLPQFTSSLDCFKHLYKADLWFRGSNILQRRRTYC